MIQNEINDILNGKDVKVDKKTKKAAKKLVKGNVGGMVSLVKELSNPELSKDEMQSKFNDFMYGMLQKAGVELNGEQGEIIEDVSEDLSKSLDNYDLTEEVDSEQ